MDETKKLLAQMISLGTHRARATDIIVDPGLEWIVETEKGREVVVCGLAEGVFVQTLIIYDTPNESNTDELLDWNFTACDEWSITPGGINTWRQPLVGCGSWIYDRADKLIYVRSIEGMLDGRVYVEIDQRLSQSLGLHWRDEVGGWGRIDRDGDWDTIVTYCKETSPHDGRVCHLVTMKRAALDSLVSALGATAITVFDVLRFDYRHTPDVGDDSRRKEIIGHSGSRTIYRSSIGPTATFTRGVQILSPNKNLHWSIYGEDDEHLTVPVIYKIYDWRHKAIRDVTNQDGQATNYFENKEGLPYDMSPAFFKPAVLTQYKGDNEKYEVQTHSILCRNAWYLQYYNFDPEQNLVYAFLKDLVSLPEREQLHWMAHNVPPTREGGQFGPITEHTERVVFRGDWDSDMTPLDKLKKFIDELDGNWWWNSPDSNHLARSGAAITGSTLEWGDEIKHLHQIVVESLDEKALRKHAVNGGMTEEEAGPLRSIRLLSRILVQEGITEREADACVQALLDLAKMRNIANAHRSTKSRQELIRDMRTEFGTLHLAFTATVNGCIQSLQQIRSILPNETLSH